jgi:hypothetical protein
MVDAIGQAVVHWERGAAGRTGSGLAHGGKR